MVRELSNEKRERFLNAALKLFASNGIQTTSTTEITKAAGTAAGTLFLYFPTKQDLINELVLKISKDQSETIYRILNPSLSVRDTFFAIWVGSVRWFLENMDAYRYSQQIRESGQIPNFVTQETAKYFRFYYETIQKGLTEGCIKPYPIDLIGSFLYQDIVAVVNHLRLQPELSNPDESIRLGFEIFWDGISIQKKEQEQRNL